MTEREAASSPSCVREPVRIVEPPTDPLAAPNRMNHGPGARSVWGALGAGGAGSSAARAERAAIRERRD
ncbi:MAG: hypothetical protein U0271_43265 [Polyangiaceae bacterium]